MSPIDHERFSERLTAYVRDGLGPDETEEMRAHLATCSVCRQEEAGLVALLAGTDEPLRSDERDRLHGAVMSAIRRLETQAATVSPPRAAFAEPRRRWMPRVAQFMAAAAVIALAAIYVTTADGGSIIGGEDGSGTTASRSRDGAVEDRSDPESAALDDGGADGGDTSAGGGGTDDSGGASEEAAGTVTTTDSGSEERSDGDGNRNAAPAPIAGAEDTVTQFSAERAKNMLALGVAVAIRRI